MSLLRRCRVNAALTIQLFSQLFHFINMWLFNRLVTDPESGLCSHYWGAIIRQQLGHVEAWAEKQGLELAADCHLSRIVQVSWRDFPAHRSCAWFSVSRSVGGSPGIQPHQWPPGGVSCAPLKRRWGAGLPGSLRQPSASPVLQQQTLSHRPGGQDARTPRSGCGQGGFLPSFSQVFSPWACASPRVHSLYGHKSR